MLLSTVNLHEGVTLAKASKRPQINADLLFIDEKLDHLLKHPLVRKLLPEIMTDFNVAYAEMLTKPLGPDVSDSEMETMRDIKTDILQAFITGLLYAHNPEGKFYPQFEKIVSASSPRIITT